MSQAVRRIVNKIVSAFSGTSIPKRNPCFEENEAGKEDLEQKGGGGWGWGDGEIVCRILSRRAEKASYQEGSKEGSCAEIRSCISGRGFYFEKECYFISFDHRSDTL